MDSLGCTVSNGLSDSDSASGTLVASVAILESGKKDLTKLRTEDLTVDGCSDFSDTMGEESWEAGSLVASDILSERGNNVDWTGSVGEAGSG